MKTIVAGLAMLLLAVTPPAHAQQGVAVVVAGSISQADLDALTDARVNIIKATLQLTPDQERYWPTIESAIRQRAKDRQERIGGIVQRTEGRAQSGPVTTLQSRDPIEFMHRRAEAMTQRAADLNKLADAWQPLYQTLTPDQKRRMAALAIVVMRDVRNAAEARSIQDY
jgi:LTXXQ motif family protein